MEYPKELLRNIYWAFSEPQYDSVEGFVDALTVYHKAVSGTTLAIDLDSVVLELPKVVFQYVKYDYDDDFEEPQIEVLADNGQSFTAKELLFKAHSLVGLELADDHNCYFEGFTLATAEDPDYPNTPVYFLDTGS